MKIATNTSEQGVGFKESQLMAPINERIKMAKDMIKIERDGDPHTGWTRALGELYIVKGALKKKLVDLGFVAFLALAGCATNQTETANAEPSGKWIISNESAPTDGDVGENAVLQSDVVPPEAPTAPPSVRRIRPRQSPNPDGSFDDPNYGVCPDTVTTP